MLEMKALLVSVLREFELEPITQPKDLPFPWYDFKIRRTR